MTPERVEEIIGPVVWSHARHVCNCDEDAPEDGEAYMTSQCREIYVRAVRTRNKREEKFWELIREMRKDKL